MYFLFFRLNLLGWQWLIKLHRFQLYNSMIYHLCIALYVYYPKSDLVSPSTLPSFTLYYPLPPSPLVTTIPLSVSMNFCLFFLFVHLLLSALYPTYEWNHMAPNFLSDWPHLAWYSQDPSTLVQMWVPHLFLWLSSIPLYICTTSSSFNHWSRDT